ncbi:MAG: agmatinase [Candidatus Heimdallarchaeota archaeon]|nr:agmatinase [Candidatus Heimdallarchaeota archaeon]
MSQKSDIKEPFFNSVTESINFANLGVLGLPWDASSSFRKGAVEGPKFIRHATSGQLYNSFAETGRNLKDTWQIFDLGDTPIESLDAEEAKNLVLSTLHMYHRHGMRFFFLGGDHLSTYFTFTALKKLQDLRIGLIYIDAHPDLYEQYEGNPYSHACVVKRIIDETNIEPETIIQVGIRSPTPDQVDYANSVGIKTITTKDIAQNGPQVAAETVKSLIPKYLDGVYLSIDLDVLDPAYAPGVGNPEPAGLTTRELIEFIHGLQGIKIHSFDIVELCPKFDPSGISALAAAKLIKEILGIL